MKPRRFIFLLTLLLLQTSTVHAQAQAETKGDSPWQLTLDLGLLMMKSTSTLDTNGENTVTSNTQKGDAPESVWTFPLFDLRYTLSRTRTQVFFGIPIEGSNIALALGVKQPIPKIGILTASIAPSYGVTRWKNPYLEGTPRKKTAADMLTTHFSLERVAFTPLNISYNRRRVDLADDDIGSLLPDLKRDGDIHALKLSYDFGLSQTSLVTPGITLEKGEITGESNSYEQAGVVLSYKRLGRNLIFVFETSASQSRYLKSHPLYERTRHETALGAFILIRKQNLLGINALHANTILGFGQVDANLDFFDVDSSFAALTVGYTI